ncbi:Uncharacterised protein [Mycolicibacterium fortuitum]|uniref:Uncharacterized protein n=1 Tax=Mycolicibacterium fortuitum TaxID=1766 RepID=A0A378WFY8_MYCFO|nr:Uncharacterised protein [Mycolicibacterium fortuitum]
MGLAEYMESQRALLDNQKADEGKRQLDRDQRAQKDVEEGEAFLRDFVKAAVAKGIRSVEIPTYRDGRYGRKSPIGSGVSGWVVRLNWEGRVMYAIGTDGILYEPGYKWTSFGKGSSKKPRPVPQGEFSRVHWQSFTNVLLGEPAFQEAPVGRD